MANSFGPDAALATGGIVTSTVLTAYYVLPRTKRIERIQWVNEPTKGGMRAFTDQM